MKKIILFFVFLISKNQAWETSPLFTRYNSYRANMDYLMRLSKDPRYADKLTIRRIGSTDEGRVIPLVKIALDLYTEDKKENRKPIILIDAGIHAREWMSPAVAMFLIHQLVENPENEHLLHNVDWYIVPMLNPDGYDYSYNSVRLWRKNLAFGESCTGVDLNRNWDYHWGENGSSHNECSNNYAGPFPFSEPELIAMRNLVFTYQKNIKLYVSLHTYGEYILYPWGYRNTTVSTQFENLHRKLGNLAAETINKVNGAGYVAGRQSDILYNASGISIDWMAGVAKIPLCFIIEMGNKVDKFAAPSRKIVPTAEEIFAGLKVMHKYVEMKWLKDKFYTVLNAADIDAHARQNEEQDIKDGHLSEKEYEDREFNYNEKHRYRLKNHSKRRRISLKKTYYHSH